MTLTVLSSLGNRLGMALGSQVASSWHGSLRREMNLRQFSAFVRLSCGCMKIYSYAYTMYICVKCNDFSMVSCNSLYS